MHGGTIELGGKFQGNKMGLALYMLSMIYLWDIQVEILLKQVETWVWNTIKSSEIQTWKSSDITRNLGRGLEQIIQKNSIE